MKSYKISDIEKVRKIRDEADEKKTNPTLKEKSTLLACIGLIFNKLLDIFEGKKSFGKTQAEETATKAHLTEFKSLIELLKWENHGQDPLFLDRLSRVWQQLLEDQELVGKKSFMSAKLNQLIDAFKHYPEHGEHSLSFYLAEHAGQKWLPFPYMEIISQLYEHHKNKPESSELNHWSALIDEMIEA